MNYTDVKVYATTTCPYCTMIAEWLTAKKVPFTKILVDQNEQAAMEMVRRTGQMGVPVTEIIMKDGKSEFIIGFNQPQLSYMLGVTS